MNRDQQKALSLLDLLITLTLVTVLLSVATPSYKHLIERNHEQSVQNELLAHLSFTRTHAITTNRSYMLCGSNNGQTCTGDWHHSWLVLGLHDRQVIRQFTPRQQLALCWRGFGENQILFRANGMSSASNGRFSFCRKEQPLWQIVINRQGRSRIAEPDHNTNCCSTDHT